ncbi:hypothetical protein [Paucibacter sp. XJ19-41]|uniref:hypothetical protein n=1 Tax=Paucibacter sp. XJ19-41 TaxID=2927824 RepID=UPI00234B1E27|nr:hypothetical protein [Paucibacter sp. XJ19-41]MDC6166516.1 hypothetical protein [Paucibacter sp. XJ19-41]
MLHDLIGYAGPSAGRTLPERSVPGTSILPNGCLNPDASAIENWTGLKLSSMWRIPDSLRALDTAFT